MLFKKALNAVAIVLATSWFAGAALAADWINVGPILSGDMRAHVDYKIKPSVPAGDVWGNRPPQGPISFRKDADPLWVNIQRSDLKSGDRVFVQIISYERHCRRGQCVNIQNISERDLELAEPGRFSGQMPAITLNYQLNDGYALHTRQQYAADLVIWINGKLYKGLDGKNLPLKMPLP